MSCLEDLVGHEVLEAKKELKRVGLSRDETSQKIIDIAWKYGHREVNRWATRQHFAEALNPEDPEAELKTIDRKLRTARRKLEKLDVPLHELYSDTLDEDVYSIPVSAREETSLKELPIWNRPYKEHTFMIMADTSMGTELHPEIFDAGLHQYLVSNGHLGSSAEPGKKISNVIGLGICPRVPERFNPVASQYLKILGKRDPNAEVEDVVDPSEEVDATAKATPEIQSEALPPTGDDVRNASAEELAAAYAPDLEEEVLEPSPIEDLVTDLDSEVDPTYRKKHVQNKITTIPEACAVIRKGYSKILGEDYDGNLFLFFNYQDRRNRVDLERKLKSTLNYSKFQLQKAEDRQEKKRARLEERIGKYEVTREGHEFLRDMLDFVRERHDEDDETTVLELVEEYRTDNQDTLNNLKKRDEKFAEAFETRLGKQKTLGLLEKFVASQSKNETKLEKRVQQLAAELRAINNKVATANASLNSHPIHQFTSHLPTDSQTDAVHHHVSMNEYLRAIQTIGSFGDNLTLHIIPEGKEDLYVGPEGFQKYLIRVSERIGRTETVRSDTIKQQKEALARDVEQGLPIPDMYLSAHDMGGTHLELHDSVRQTIQDGVYFEAVKEILFVKQGPFDSKRAIEKAIRNDINKVKAVQRYLKGCHDSGVSIVTVKEDGTPKFTNVPAESIRELGIRALGKQYQEALEQLQKPRISKKKRQQYLKVIDHLNNLAKTEPELDGVLLESIKITQAPESHVGSDTPGGHISGLEILCTSLKSAEKNDVDLLVFGGDNIHAQHVTKGNVTVQNDYALIFPIIDRVNRVIETDANLTDKQRLALSNYVSKLVYTGSARPSTSKQKADLKIDGATYEAPLTIVQRLLQKERKMFVAVSGNHPNKSHKFALDEATELANMLPNDLVLSPKVEVIAGHGEGDARGQISLNPLRTEYQRRKRQKLMEAYLGHGMGGGHTPALSMGKKASKMRGEAKIYLGHHYHVPSIGIFAGRICAIGSGGQPTGQFVESCGLTGSCRADIVITVPRSPMYHDKGHWTFSYKGRRQLEQIDPQFRKDSLARKILWEYVVPLARGKEPRLELGK